MARTRIKFCGITRAGDAAAAVAAGADAIGLVLVPRSPRFVDALAAAALRSAVPPLVTVVALFQDADAEFVRHAIAALKPGCLQFHGEERDEFCAGFGVPYIKAVSMRAPQDLAALSQRYPSAAALLLDSHAGGGAGGTGRVFDWSAVGASPKPVVVAGGLTPDNVGDAIRALRPFAVDVASGIESSAGVKDSAKMRAFAEAVRMADQELNG